MPISPPATPGSEVEPCPICQEPIAIDDQEITDCGHAFHTECLAKWFETTTTCPICRTVILTEPTSPPNVLTPSVLTPPQIDFVAERNIVCLFSGIGFLWYILAVLDGSCRWFEILSIIYNSFGMIGAIGHNLCLLYIYSTSWPFQAGILAMQYKDGTFGIPRNDTTVGNEYDPEVFITLYLFVYGFFSVIGFAATYRMMFRLRKYQIALNVYSRHLELTAGFYNSVV